jgi:hypothetical protein
LRRSAVAKERSNAKWSDDISSLRVGPNAFVLAYENKQFKGGMLRLAPNQAVPDLREMRFNDEIDSLKVINSLKIFDWLWSERAPTASQTRVDEKISGQTQS